MQLTILNLGVAAPVEIIYIFEHTTVQEFLEILNKEKQYEYLFKGEIINEIPPYYFMVTLGLENGAIIGRRDRISTDID